MIMPTGLVAARRVPPNSPPHIRTHDVEPRTLLVNYIREHVGLTGTNIGCDTSSCGACSVHLNGEAGEARSLLERSLRIRPEQDDVRDLLSRMESAAQTSPGV